MNQIVAIFRNLTLRQRIYLAAAAIAVIGGLVAFRNWSDERDFRPLFTGLAPEDANAVVTRLRERGAEFHLKDGGSSVLVRSSQVDELRIEMAGAGIPRSGRIGFELFDRTQFGTTEFAEQVNYHRAIEGELERSVMALAEVEQARVHITFPKDSVFVESRRPAKASVMVRLRPGAKMSPQSVAAICHLAASAVEGLMPEAVTVVDMRGNLLSRPRRSLDPDADEPSEAIIEYRQKIERDLVAKINSTLEPLLGPDKFRAGISVECDFTSGEQSEETYDPNKTAVLTSQKQEDVKEANQANGVPGTASSLPRPTSRPGQLSNGISRRNESMTYQPSRVVRHVRLPQGTLRRISVALLVDYSVRWSGPKDKQKRTVEPVSPERLKVIKDLVAGAVGLVPTRGDQLIVESLPFESTLNWEPGEESPATPAAPFAWPAWVPGWLRPYLEPFVSGQGNLMLVGLAVGSVLAVLVGLLWRIIRRKRSKAAVGMTPALPDAAGDGSKTSGGAALEHGGVEAKFSGEFEKKLSEQRVLQERQAQEALAALKLPPVATQRAEVLTKHLVDEARKDPEGVAKLIRSWMTDKQR